LQGSGLFHRKALQSQNCQPSENRLSLKGLEFVHGQLVSRNPSSLLDHFDSLPPGLLGERKDTVSLERRWMNELAASKHDFVTLDGLRGVAAVAIVTRHSPEFWHTMTAYGSIPNPAGQLPEVGPLFESYLAVDFFFVLSGFVLMHAYEQRLRDGMSTVQFMLVRLIRLYPLYLLALALTLLPYAWAALHSTPGLYGNVSILLNVALAVLMLPSPISHDPLFPLNIPAWSLFFELLANAVFALNGGNLTTKRLSAIVAAAGLILCCAVVLREFGFGTRGIGAMDAGSDWSSFGAGLLRVSFSFFAGALTYRVWQKWLNQFHVPAVLIVGTLMAVLAVHPPIFLERVYDLTVTIIVFPALVLVGASSKPGVYWARLFLGLGLASYGVYVLQVPVYGTVIGVLSKLTSASSFTASSGIAFIAFLFLFALATDYLFDVPIRGRLRIHMQGR
jgi:peptidoglycan/LPS O-acetylase OafA/YrhL